MIKNHTGIEDDDMLNLGAEVEETERFKDQVWKDIRDEFGFSRLMDRKNVYNFHVIKDLLYTKHNMEYTGTDDREDIITHIFQNDLYTLELDSYENYPRLNNFHLSRIDIYRN